MLVPGDLADPSHCRRVIDEAVDAFGHIDVLVNNAALQRTYSELEEIPDEEWELHFRTNISAMFHLCKAAVPHMQAGGSIINTASVNVDMPKPTLLPYATTKGAIANFTAGLAQLLASRGIRVNSVLPGPVWTPLIPFDHAAGPGRVVRQACSARTAGAARRARRHLRAACLGRGKLHVRRRLSGNRREANSMKAVTWQGKRDVRVEDVPDPVILEPSDVIVRAPRRYLRVHLHLYEVLGPFLDEGDVLGSRGDGDRRGGWLRGDGASTR